MRKTIEKFVHKYPKKLTIPVLTVGFMLAIVLAVVVPASIVIVLIELLGWHAAWFIPAMILGGVMATTMVFAISED